MATHEQLRKLAAECRADREKAPVSPDDLDALLDIAELHVEEPAEVVAAR